MGIYTKAGDRGYTSTINRRNIPKNSRIFTVLGTLDEVSSTLGTAKPFLDAALVEKVDALQKDIFAFNGELAGAAKFATAQKVAAIEEDIDSITAQLGDMNAFVLPGNTPGGAALDVARTVMRRCEREAISLSQIGGISREAMSWINRVSDYIYVLARFADSKGTMKAKLSATTGGGISANGMKPMVGSHSLSDIADDLCKVVIAKAREMGLKVVVAVCDNGGNLLSLKRDDDAFIASVDIAINKAFTSISLKMSTQQVGELSKPGASLYGLQYTNSGRIVIFGGGDTLTMNGEIVGGLGVSGGSAEEDLMLCEFGKKIFEGGI